VREGVWEPWCDYHFQVVSDRDPEPVELGGEGSGKEGGAIKGDVVLRGLRYRLDPIDVGVTRPLPFSGKV
jgi:hypothetical protein